MPTCSPPPSRSPASKYRPPKEQYLDGIDQTSFLLADAGLSNRKYVYYWLQDVFSGLRVAEYKFVVAGMSEDEPDVINPGGSTVLESYKNGKLYNLYLDPRERFSFFNRQTFMDNLFTDPMVCPYGHVQEIPGQEGHDQGQDRGLPEQ